MLRIRNYHIIAGLAVVVFVLATVTGGVGPY